jgi:hypothetical protein
VNKTGASHEEGKGVYKKDVPCRYFRILFFFLSWLSHFESRHDIKICHLFRERKLVDMELMKSAIYSLLRKTRSTYHKDVFIIDET